MAVNVQDLVTRIYNEIPRNPKTALKWAEEGLAQTNKQPDGLMIGKLMLCRAHALRECGRYEEAVRDYDRAKKILLSHKEPVEGWRTAIGKIDALNQLGRYREALRTSEKALRFFSRNRLPIWLAKTHANMGNVYHNLGKYSMALKHYRIGYSALHTERPLDGYVLLFNQASIHLCQGKPELALDLLSRCMKYFEEQNLSSFLGRTYYNVAYAYYVLGKYENALKYLSQAKFIFKKFRDAQFMGLCFLDQAEIQLRLNRVEEAVEMATKARRRFKELQMPYESAESSFLLGLALLKKNRLSSAVRFLSEAYSFFQRQGNAIKCAELDSNLALAFWKQRYSSKAESHLQRAYKVFVKNRVYFRMLSTLTSVAAIQLEKGDWRETRASLAKARTWLKKVRHPWVLLPYYQLLGRVESNLRLPTASFHLNKAIRLVEEMRSEIPAEDLRISFLKDKLEPFDLLISHYLNRTNRHNIQKAFLLTERAKSRSLQDLLEKNLVLDPDHGKAKELAAALNAMNYQSWPRSVGTSPAGNVAPYSLEKRILDLFREIQTTGKRYQPQVFDVKRIQEELHPDQKLLCYYFVDDDLQAFVLDKERLSVHIKISSHESLWRRWKLFQFQLERSRLNPDVSLQSCEAHLEDFFDSLMGNFYSRLQDAKIITIIPHGWLHGFPFHCLRNNRGYLVERHQFTYAPSAGVFLHTQAKECKNQGFLLIGHEDEYAPNIGREIAEIRDLYPDARVCKDQDASSIHLADLASGFRIIHIAAHGRFQNDQPLFSGILLSDGWFTLPQIYRLKLDAELVTLSGCQTGTNQISAGDELVGLARAFLYAGTASLLVSLWRVSDDSTALFMRQFYSYLSSGMEKSQAWQKAVLHTKQQWSHPYFWGPFLLIGKISYPRNTV